MMSKKFIPLMFVVVVILVVAGMWLGLYLSQLSSAALSPYTAVYLSTGDIYFGRFSQFPSPQIQDAWFLQRSGDQQNPQLSIIPLTSTFWGPASTMSLNPKEIVFWVRLRADSQVALTLANPTAAQAQQQSALPNAMPQGIPSASSSKGMNAPSGR